MDPAYAKKSVYKTWLLLCFTIGPVSSMSRTYIPAVLQTLARTLGENAKGSMCSNRGNDCFIWLGSWQIRSNSYVLYLKALVTLVESMISLLIMNIADFSSYRKWIICFATAIYGGLAVPYAGLFGASSMFQLISISVLYCLANITNTVLQIMIASYIPSFMRSQANEEMKTAENLNKIGDSPEQIRRSLILRKGSKVSVMGGFLSNCGGIVAQLIGIIIAHVRLEESSQQGVDGFRNFLIAITVAGSITFTLGIVMFWLVPPIKNQPRPQNEYLILLTLKRSWSLLKGIRRFPNAYLFCLAWVVWNLTYSNFMSMFVLLFRSTLGIGSTDSEYTVYTWLSFVLASLGSLTWMVLYPRTPLKIKTWAYIFLGFALFSQFWACLGISTSSPVGFKNRWEFWFFDIFYSSTSSALRSLNRTVYSSMLPIGEEAQYFGLEIILGNLVGWGVDLLVAFIQDRTNNDRFPFLLNLFLVVVSLILYISCNTENGMFDVEKAAPQQEEETSECINEDNNPSGKHGPIITVQNV